MAHLRRERTPHTEWCARDHRCGLDEHRGPGLIADAVGGRAVVTRVRAGDVDYVEVTARIRLHSTEIGARWQVAATLRLMRELLTAVAVRRGVLSAGVDRPALPQTEGFPVERRELDPSRRRFFGGTA
ncbi:hypothetical protein ACQP2F_00465 [Actinoplanes sp. CA-030573]|uniref:hypothetical protein n=1 Tax=Actinoplanes sp. CA-030573 TaxID=3239898 RepID=UPI003D924EA1